MRVYPVVHHLDPALTLEQAGLAMRAGADGVFLIDHHGDNDALDEAVRHLAPVFGSVCVGVNYLGMGFRAAYEKARTCGAGLVWADDPGVTSKGISDEARWVAGQVERQDNATWVFASVAFKYQPFDPDPPRAAMNAQGLGFIPTTSGIATGAAPLRTKVNGMAAALTGGPLAVASGLTAENVASFAPGLTHCLVATSVCAPGDEHRFDPDALRRFVEVARAA